MAIYTEERKLKSRFEQFKHLTALNRRLRDVPRGVRGDSEWMKNFKEKSEDK